MLAVHVPQLHALHIRRVLNMQDENSGPTAAYTAHGMEQLHLPVVDHHEPTLEQIGRGVRFIEQAQRDGVGVYIHCQGGHGRSAAIVFAWMCVMEQHKTPQRHNTELDSVWRVRKTLHHQPHVNSFIAARRTRSEAVVSSHQHH